MALTLASTTAYPHSEGGRDLRIDFLRGLIMVYVIIVHFEYASVLSIFAWDKLAIISSAEGFVFLSGVVVGMVYKRRIERIGLGSASRLLWRRSFELYRINVFVILSILLLQLLPFVNVFEVTHWTHPWSHESFPLFPPEGTDILTYLRKTLLLQIVPHQYQVIGLYVVLLAVAPFALYLVVRGKVSILLLISWGLYAANHFLHLKITGARYELAFPTLTWQLLFFHGMAIGYYRRKTLGYITGESGRWLFYLSLVLAAGFLFLANNNENPLFWPWGHFTFIDPMTFGTIYRDWFVKSTLGLGRLLNNVVMFILAYYLLTHYWRYFEHILGWVLIPLGQNSLYVFTLHVYFIVLVSNTHLPERNNFLINSFIHLAVIFTIWGMVKYRVLFSIVPR